MSDAIDSANELAEWQREQALKNHSAQVRKMVNTDPFCDECGDEIPAARRRLVPHAICCVDCQASLEAKTKHYK